MLDRALIGTAVSERRIRVESYPLRFFAKAIGEQASIHNVPEAARAAGFASTVAPPTYAMCLETMSTENELVRSLGIDLREMLHGEQSFAYHRPIVEGDVLLLNSRVDDIYLKKGGLLEFVVI